MTMTKYETKIWKSEEIEEYLALRATFSLRASATFRRVYVEAEKLSRPSNSLTGLM